MAVKLITPPVNEPITLAEAKAHLRVDHTDDDSIIAAMLSGARQNVEGWLGRALIDQTWDLYLDGFPIVSSDTGIQIPLPPLIEVVSVKYDDTDGVEQTMDSADYYVDTANEPGWVVPAGTPTWPTPIDAINNVRVRFRAGYLSLSSPSDNDAVPFDIKAGILLTLGSLYEHREMQVIDATVNALPFGVENLIRKHRVLFGMA